VSNNLVAIKSAVVKNSKTTKLTKKSIKKVPLSLVKSPLKWAGGKRKLVADIAKLIPINKRLKLIEPFVGGGSVFLNLTFDNYLLVDSNPDLIGFFTHIRDDHENLIKQSEALFIPSNNSSEQYYKLREEFNRTPASLRRSALFLYLNRHGFNGLCRYNLKGGYNVPFGQYKKPYFPHTEINIFSAKAQSADLVSGDFSIAFTQARKGDLVYCDPPYTPINETASFTAYSGKGFTINDQQRLVDCALHSQTLGITTIISNHNLPQTRTLYAQADKMVNLTVARNISCKGHIRKPCAELIAVFKGKR
jgi:DNA adenine methylase